MKKTALGKGLGALMGEINEINETPKNQGVLEVDISLIDRDENQPRKHFDEEKLSELAQSLQNHGVMQPLIVVKKGARYVIVAGERRYRAARKAGLKTLPVIIKNLSERDILEMALVENIQREDLNAIEQANALITLMEKYSMTQEQAAKRVGKSRPAIANLVRLASLPEKIKKAVLENRISAGHARAILSLKDDELMDIAYERVVAKELSVRQTEELVRSLLSPKKAPAEKKAPSPEWLDAQNKLSSLLDTKVSLSGSESKGKIVIEYYSKEQLMELFDKISK